MLFVVTGCEMSVYMYSHCKDCSETSFHHEHELQRLQKAHFPQVMRLKNQIILNIQIAQTNLGFECALLVLTFYLY